MKNRIAKIVCIVFVMMFSWDIIGCNISNKNNTENKLKKQNEDGIYWDGVTEWKSPVKFAAIPEKMLQKEKLEV